jgi:hypothetical protein
MVKFKKDLHIAEVLPEDTVMVGEAMPLTTNAFETNNKITEFLKGREYLKKMLVEKICGS